MLNTALQNIRYLFSSRIFEFEAKTYYEGTQEKQSLRKLFKLMNVHQDINFFSPIQIQFRGVSLLDSLKLVTKVLGKPALTSSKHYFNAAFKTLAYKHEVHEVQASTIINLLDNKVISCTYHIDTTSKEVASKIKQTLCSKYGIDNDFTDTSFCIIDEFENKIIFTLEHELVIHYVAAGKDTQEKITAILSQIEGQKQRLLRKEKHQMELAF